MSESSPSERVLVVIPCLNEETHLGGLIDEMLKQATLDSLLVIADGGSVDASLAIVEEWMRRDPRVRIIHNSDRLQSAGINSAVDAFGKDRTFLIRVDAHAGYPANFLPGLVSTAKRTSAASVVVPMATVGSSCFQIAAAAAQNSKIGAGGSAHRNGGQSGWIDHGHHALMRIDAFNAIGGYNGAFSHNEDAEYDFRLAKSGGRVWLEADLAIRYFPRKSATSLYRQYVNYGKGRARTVSLHRMPLKLRQIAPAGVAPAVVVGFIALVLAVVSNPIWLALSIPLAVWMTACVIGGIAAGISARAGKCGLLAGVAAMIMHFAWSVGFLSGVLKRGSQAGLSI